MKKSNFVAMIMGTIGGIFSALGMVMCLESDFGDFKIGVIMGSIGLVILLLTVVVWRKMTGKAPIRFSAKTIGTTLLAVIGALLLGVGMCLTMVWGNVVMGVIVGIVGIVTLLSLIPLTKGLAWR
ncbi:hypothetical protein Hs30E_05890 [Lactococcus hodotermopsidis]|uniref:Uncharacterized protein n=1 Tax=Pseudolactococcus hodotermopsidis TaxID=2709157 RepID=A0A6A0BCF4_9LACT|nr:hypothetical protein [Lactococcus hodotermopsidis]GFH42038.1 hypothetical protein Hs30E_05890 [Lactococcus hodotermopsidis]